MGALHSAIRLLGVLSLLTGILYPLAITGIARIAFPRKAEGSLVVRNGVIAGSFLIGQRFDGHEYFRPRPSAIDYNPLPSGGSNLGVIDEKLRLQVHERDSFVRQSFGLGLNDTIPADLLFSSASGLDPDISPEAARLQTAMVAKNRRFSSLQTNALKTIVERSIEPRQLGFLGEPRINVLRLNIALDSLEGRSK
jgi:potassium-transporting ATPase KdpC subunit